MVFILWVFYGGLDYAYVSECQLESACKDRLAKPHLGFPQKIFAILDFCDHYVVLTLSIKLVSFFYIYYHLSMIAEAS